MEVEFDKTLEKESKEILFNLIQKTSKIVLFRVYYNKNSTYPPDPQNRIYIDLGKTSNQILGISQRISSEEFLSHIHPNQIDQLMVDLRAVNKNLDLDIQFFNSEIKKYIWIHILSNFMPLNNENEEKKCLIGIIEDITNIKQKELSLNKKDEQIQSFKVISVIASMLMHRNEKLDENIFDILKTMGNTLKASSIAIYKDIEVISNKDSEDLHPYTLSDKWCAQYNIEICKKFDEIFINKLLSQLESSSMKMYIVKNIDEYPSELTPLLEQAKIGSFLRVPIFTGKNRYGTMIVNYNDKNRQFNHNEIVLSMNIAYLVGLGLKINKENESKINFLQFFDDLQLGLFILQQDEAGIYKFAYVNSQICKISGHTKEEIYNVSNFSDLVLVEDESFMRSFQSKEFAVKNLPRSFDIKINVKNEKIPVKVWLGNDEFNNHYAIYGIVYNLLENKEISSIYNELIE